MKTEDLNRLADRILKENHFLFMDGGFFLYQNGVFRPQEDADIKKIIKKKLGMFSNIRSIEEISNALSIECAKKRAQLPVQKEYVNVMNGMIELRTGKLVDHSAAFFSTFQLPVNYIKGEKCQRFMSAVQEWLEESEKIQLLQEYLGYCLLPFTDQEKILFLLGDGANGKSTLIKVIKAVFGSENCSFIPLDRMKDRFNLAGLRGKAINFSPEVASDDQLCDSLVKSIVSGDDVLAEEKYKPPFYLTPTAKLIVACNDMPYSKDKSHATDRRLLILKFNRSFSDRCCDKELGQKLIAEKDGIFSWILKGLKQLCARGHFKEPQESGQERENYRKECNPVLSFVEGHCEVGPLFSVSKGGLYREYRNFCESAGRNPVSINKFGKELRRHYSVLDDMGMANGRRARLWIGIKLVTEVETYFFESVETEVDINKATGVDGDKLLDDLLTTTNERIVKII